MDLLLSKLLPLLIYPLGMALALIILAAIVLLRRPGLARMLLALAIMVL